MFAHDNNTERFYDVEEELSGEAIRAAIRGAIDYASKREVKVAALLLPVLSRVEELEDYIDEALAHDLKRDRKAKVGDVELLLGSFANPPRAGGAPVVAVFIGDKDLRTLDDRRPSALFVVASDEERITQWLENWQPARLRPETPELPDQLPGLSPELEKAMQGLTSSVNLNTALVDPRDKKAAKGVLHRHRRDPSYDPAALRAWAVSHGWKASSAHELEELARKYI